jgi:hypothetical protein
VVSAAYTSVCTYNITSYGAVGNGSTDNTTAINNAFAAAAAASPKCSVEIPAGTFNYSNQLNMNGITVFGFGSTSILNSTNTNASAITMQGSGPSLSNLVILGTGTTRTAGSAQSMIWVQNASNFTVNNILIDGGSCTGVWDNGSSNGVIENVTVHNTLADSITNTNGANNVTVQNNLVYNSGDDGYSNNSYVGDGNQVNNITETQNTFLSGNARGMECSGCRNTTFTGNYIDNTSGYSDLWIASESSSYQTQAVSAITATGNTLVHGGPNQGAIEYWSESSSNSISSITINGNQWYNTTTFTANQITGSGTLSGFNIENSNAYINPVSFGTYPGSCTSCTMSNNTTYATSAYPGPIAPPLGGTVPIFSLPSGTYTLPQTLTLNEVTSGDAITYCTTSSGTCTPATAYSSALTISASEVVCSRGTNSASTLAVPSATVCATYTSSSAPPALTQCGQWNTNPYPTTPTVNTINVGGTVQQAAWCYYASVPATTNCSTTDTYGNGVTAWGPASSSVISVGQIGSAHPGLVTGLSAGTASSTATVTGGVSCSSWGWTVNNVTPTLSSAAMVIQSGGSSVPVGGTAQMCVNLAYVSPTENTQVCGSGTDAYGTAVNTYTSSSPSNATIGSSTGILTGVATGSTTVQASVNSGAYTPSLAVSVVMPSVTPAGLQQGNAILQGSGLIQ